MTEETKPDELSGSDRAEEGNGVASGPDAVAQPMTDSDPQAGAGEAEPIDPLEAAQAELQRVRDQLLRTAADFDNFRKRTRRELVDAEKRGSEDLLRELLPVFDNLERAEAHAEGATDVQSLADGIRMVLRQFYDTLSRIGIERIDAQGTRFDPTLMEAIQQLETTEHEPGTVAQQVQAGYRMGDRLIRPAMVVVAKAKSS